MPTEDIKEVVNEGAELVTKQAASPLRFFAIVVAVLTVFMGAIITSSSSDITSVSNILKITFGFVIFLVVLVSILIIFFPERLYDQNAHLAESKKGTDSAIVESSKLSQSTGTNRRKAKGKKGSQ